MITLQGRIWGPLVLVLIGFFPVFLDLFRGGSSKEDKIIWISFFLVLIAVIVILMTVNLE